MSVSAKGLMTGKRGLIMGVANSHSIAWGIAQALAAEGAQLAFTYQGEALGKRVAPLAESLGSKLILPCDVEDIASVDAVFATLEKEWASLDFVVHAIGFSDKNELKGRYIDATTRENFSRTMVISAFSFTEIAQRASKLMPYGGSLLTLTYGGSTRVMPNYNVMGVAKAALEASVRYLASDWRAGRARQRHFRRADPHAGGRGHRRRPLHVQFPEGACAAAPHGDDRGRGRLRALPSVRPVGGRHRRGAFRRRRLQHHLHAAARQPQGGY